MNQHKLLLLALAASNAFSAQAEDIAHCTSIDDSALRLSCYDRAAGMIDDLLQEKTVAANAQTSTTADTVASSSPLADRFAREEALMNNPFVVIPHFRNYILPVTYNSKANIDPFEEAFPGVEMDDIEAKFQISFKVRLWENIIGKGDLWAAYTQQNWWQVYNDDESAPFRETNYEPEALVVWDNDWQIAGFTNTKIGLGLNHQSNGRGELLSRSWNRVMASASFERQNLVVLLRAWHRIEEDDDDDDNPNMDRYYGYGDFRLAYHWGEHEFSTMIRNNLRSSDNKGAIQLDWTMPLNDRFSWYIQLFHGYGESLIDYNVETSRIGVGFSMNNLF